MGHDEDGKIYMEKVDVLEGKVSVLEKWQIGIDKDFEFFKINTEILTDLLKKVTESNEQSAQKIEQNDRKIELMEIEHKNSLKLCQVQKTAEIKAVEVRSDIADIKQQSDSGGKVKSKLVELSNSKSVVIIVATIAGIIMGYVSFKYGFSIPTIN